MNMSLSSGVNHGGTGRDCPPKVLTGGDSSVDCPPKVQALEGQCWVLLLRSHKELITYYNFQAVSVKFQFPLYIMTSGGSRETRTPSLTHLKN